MTTLTTLFARVAFCAILFSLSANFGVYVVIIWKND